jgi:zinc D-Ala-D-Ala carboxypeptidase
MQLSPNFSLEEFTKSQTGARLGIANTPSAAHLANLKTLCAKVLEPVRAHYGKPVHINSGYRGPALNKAVGGASTSQHCAGEAADIEIPGVANGALAKWIEANLEYDQLILECYSAGVPNSGWVHVSFKAGHNRKQELTATMVGGKMKYAAGLHL